MPIAWSMTTCPAWTTTTCAAGLPTVHVKWDEATAVLAGDALQTLAFELLADPALGSAEVRMELVAGLARASGQGMVLGQALDIAAETAAAPLTLDQITALAGGQDRRADPLVGRGGGGDRGADVAPLRRYATALGLAFQIADDILDVTGDEAKTGKRVGKDADAGKATFVSLLGLEGRKAPGPPALVDEAEAALSPYGAAAANLIAAARFVIARDTAELTAIARGGHDDRPTQDPAAGPRDAALRPEGAVGPRVAPTGR
jgi:farnesyl diphosphate synthase